MTSSESVTEETVIIDDQDHRILMKRGYKVENKSLSRSQFASVFSAKFNDIHLAVKVIDSDRVSNDYKNKYLPRELYVINKLKHRFIIAKKEILTINRKVFIVMEFAEGGDLYEMIKNVKRIDEMNAKTLFRQISEALDYMHGEAIAHRDLKCENILLNKSQSVAKITDFGFSRTCFENTTGRRLLTQTQCGSRAYVGPEVIKGEPFDAILSDCWSMGVVLYLMTFGKLPFSPKLSTKELLSKQLIKNYSMNGTDISDDCKNLIVRLLEPKPKTRLNMKQVLKHNWIKNVRV